MTGASGINWDVLVHRINKGECTPFLGAGVSRPTLPSATELAEALAGKCGYPLKDGFDLMRVAQYIATMKDDAAYPKDLVCDLFKDYGEPDYSREDEPHAFLASLDLPLYVTTNYDLFMSRALKRQKKDVTREVCRWSEELKRRYSSHLVTHEATAAQPVVYHIHGTLEDASSMVLTEDDYLDFMVNVQQKGNRPEDRVLPPRVEEALTTTSLLFIGYGLRDWNLRVLLRALRKQLERSTKRFGVTVQVEADESLVDAADREKVREFLDKYFGGLHLSVYWGKADDFVTELKTELQKS